MGSHRLLAHAIDRLSTIDKMSGKAPPTPDRNDRPYRRYRHATGRRRVQSRTERRKCHARGYVPASGAINR